MEKKGKKDGAHHFAPMGVTRGPGSTEKAVLEMEKRSRKKKGGTSIQNIRRWGGTARLVRLKDILEGSLG